MAPLGPIVATPVIVRTLHGPGLLQLCRTLSEAVSGAISTAVRDSEAIFVFILFILISPSYHNGRFLVSAMAITHLHT